MRRWLFLIPQLAHAIACVVVILIAKPLLALLDSQRRTQGHDMDNTSDTSDNPELTTEEKTLHDASAVLDNAGAPRTDTERDGLGINVSLNLAGRILWLIEQRDDLSQRYNFATDRLQALTEQHDAELSEANRRADQAESDLSGLHTQLRGSVGAESTAEALEMIATLKKKVDDTTRDLSYFRDVSRNLTGEISEINRTRTVLMRQRDEAVGSLRDIAEALNLPVTANGATVKVAVDVLSNRARRFATTVDPQSTILRADIVVDVSSGTVVKNRHGKSFMLKKTAKRKKRPTKKPTSAKTKTRKRA